MKLLSIEITNFRSIRERLTIRENDARLCTFVGANNLGKSNIPRAINLFFNKEVEPGLPFNAETDISEGQSRAVSNVSQSLPQSEN